jgi:hypothetical protein
VAAALAEANRRWPKRSRRHDGVIGDQDHAGRQSDHNPDARGIVHAFDLTHDPVNGVDCEMLAVHLKYRRDRRVKNIIWNRHICVYTDWKWIPYHQKPHTEHMHVSILSTPEAEDDVSPWWDLSEWTSLYVPSFEFQLQVLNKAPQWDSAFGATTQQVARRAMAMTSAVGQDAAELGHTVVQQLAQQAQQLGQWAQQVGQEVISLPPSPSPVPPGQNRPPPPGYRRLRRNEGLPKEVVDQSKEYRRAHSRGCSFCLHGRTPETTTPYPFGAQIQRTMGGKNYVFAIEWHQHGAEEKVPDALKVPHHGCSVFVPLT